MKIVVCDDEQEMAEEWAAAIEAIGIPGAEISRMADPLEEVSLLVRRKVAVREKRNLAECPSGFDGIDVLVVDYDLVLLDAEGSRTTGEGIARLARTYSQCGAIVVMNQYKGAQFDLGMRGHLESFADFNVDAELVGSASLWKKIAPTASEFNPTTWTPLTDFLAAAQEFATTLETAGFDANLMHIMGLEQDALVELSDTAFGFLSVDAETTDDLAALTLREFLRRSLEDDVVEYMSANAEKLLFGFAAFRLIKWLDRAVLRPMDVLIDPPHLVDRLPFLVDENNVDVSDPEAWTNAVLNPQEALNWEILEKFHNATASRILGKTVFDWFRIDADDAIGELQDAYLEKETERFHLTEDTSRFVKKDELTRFRADFHNFGDRRAIEKLDGITYGPLRRMRFG